MDAAFSFPRDSFEAPSPTPPIASIQLSLLNEERAQLLAKVEHLQHFPIIGKVVGSCPSRGGLQGLLQELLSEVGKIKDLYILGRNSVSR